MHVMSWQYSKDVALERPSIEQAKYSLEGIQDVRVSNAALETEYVYLILK